MSLITILDLPVELIEYILCYDNLEFKDVINFSSGCHRFRDIVLNSNVLWRNKFMAKYVYIIIFHLGMPPLIICSEVSRNYVFSLDSRSGDLNTNKEIF